MKNKDGDSVICGTLILSNPITINIKVVGDDETILDNISGLSDMGYEDKVSQAIHNKEDIDFDIESFEENKEDFIEYLLSVESAVNARKILMKKKNKTEPETQLYDFAELRLEFFGEIVDGR